MNKKVLKWNFIFQYGYAITNIINAVILLPLYLKYINATALGIWLASGNILGWMLLTDPGVAEVLQQKIAELRGRKNGEEVGKTIGSGFIAAGFILVVALAAGFGFCFVIGSIIDKDLTQYPGMEPALIISVVSTAMLLFSFSTSCINLGLHNSSTVAIATILGNILYLITNVIFLYAGYGVMSIAFSNLIRAVFINVYNLSSMQKMLRKEDVKVVFNAAHFKKFIRIFSFTSASKVISGLSATVDMIILARYLPGSMITTYEINKRPIFMTQSLIGRHSVALMPLISHGKGKEDQRGVVSFINKQFRFYSYAVLFVSFIFWLDYRDMISLWTGPGQYAGDLVTHLLILNFFFTLIGYFMSNMGYALGDIKMNSLVNIIKGVLLTTLIFFVAPRYGVTGTLLVWLGVTFVADFFYFSFRLFKLQYLHVSLLKNILSAWLFVVPFSVLSIWGSKLLVAYLFDESLYLPKLMVGSVFFTVSFILILLSFDSEVRSTIKQFKDTFFLRPFFR